MKVIETLDEIRAQVREWKKEGRSIGLVPTMGYLHEGHGSLIQQAVAQNARVVVSDFVNPMQFSSPGEDLEEYPRDLEQDTAFCEQLGADVIFHPAPEVMYPHPFLTYVDVDQVTEGLCGASRPDMFRGVCTVISKLFHLITPDRAYFGKKDAQQLAVIRKMTEDLNFDVEIIGVAIVREQDGLAKSSRNTYLTQEERNVAPMIYQVLKAAKKAVEQGQTDAAVLSSAFMDAMAEEPLFDPEYAEIVDQQTMQPVKRVKGDGSCLMAVAVRLGKARLIDNIEL